MMTRSFIAACLLLAALSTPATAHSSRDEPRADSGIPIQQLTHGQMAVIAGYRGAIVDLAARQPRTDPTLRRLANFTRIQYAWCLWGLAPGSLADEASPFNECAHAYLAGARAVLLHLRTASADPGPVEALAARIEGAMLRANASLVLCRYSGQAFNTAAVIAPRWSDVPFHAPSLAMLLGLGLTAAAGLAWLLRRPGPQIPGK